MESLKKYKYSDIISNNATVAATWKERPLTVERQATKTSPEAVVNEFLPHDRG